MLTTARAFLTALRLAVFPPAPRLVGIQTFNGRAYNPILGTVVPIQATAQLLIDHKGKRSVKLSDGDLKKEPVVIAWLKWGVKPDGMTIAA